MAAPDLSRAPARARQADPRAGPGHERRALCLDFDPELVVAASAECNKIGRDLDVRRFRGNFWVEGWAPWEEFDLEGKTLSIGGIAFEVVERITRCRATESNPDTGRPDAETLLALERGWGHRDFGVYARALGRGTVDRGAPVRIL